SNQSDLYGWKTSLASYNDAAVWGTWNSILDKPTGNWKSISNFNQQPINLAFKLTTPTNPPPPQGCIETNGVKYVQWPNLVGGYDVWNSGPWVLADDFICTNTGPVTDIHIWGSWLSNVVSTNLTFTLAIYDDVPVGPTNNFSHPGTLQWQEQFTPGRYLYSF